VIEPLNLNNPRSVTGTNQKTIITTFSVTYFKAPACNFPEARHHYLPRKTHLLRTKMRQITAYNKSFYIIPQNNNKIKVFEYSFLYTIHYFVGFCRKIYRLVPNKKETTFVVSFAYYRSAVLIGTGMADIHWLKRNVIILLPFPYK